MNHRLKLWKRSLRFFWQNLTRGWNDSETWALEHSLAKLILPRLKRFQHLRIGYPADSTEKEWNDNLNEMIWGFEWYANKPWYCVDYLDPDAERAYKAIQLFAKHYPMLWW